MSKFDMIRVPSITTRRRHPPHRRVSWLRIVQHILAVMILFYAVWIFWCIEGVCDWRVLGGSGIIHHLIESSHMHVHGTTNNLISMIMILLTPTQLHLTHHPVGLEQPNTSTSNIDLSSALEDLASVDYIACCGLGHRLLRMAAAHHVARVQLQGWDFRTFWGWCGGAGGGAGSGVNTGNGDSSHDHGSHNRTSGKDMDNDDDDDDAVVEIFSSLFEPTAAYEIDFVAERHQRVRYLNEVDGYKAIQRVNASSLLCPCNDTTKIYADVALYQSLQRRFRFRSAVDQFWHEQHLQHNLTHATVVGLHVRAGNGEHGDFDKKHRDAGVTVADQQQDLGRDRWIRGVWQELLQFLHHANATANYTLPPPLLYVATDTPAVLLALQHLSRTTSTKTTPPTPSLPVISWEQDRPADGTGVFFSTAGNVANRHATSKHQCIQRWIDAVMDLLLLSKSDVVVAGRPSSFVQSMPLTMALKRPVTERKIPHAVYCEIVSQPQRHHHDDRIRLAVTGMPCFASYQDWCCNSTAIDHRLEHVRFPVAASAAGRLQLPKPLPRPTYNHSNLCYPRPGYRPKMFCLSHGAWQEPPSPTTASTA